MNYSLGMRQRLALAMALVGNPQFLILDEPLNGLDPEGIKDVRAIIAKLNEEYGITIIMVLHEINQAIHFSDEIIGLKGGNVLVHGKPEEVITTESISELYDVHLDVAEIDGQKFVLTV